MASLRDSLGLWASAQTVQWILAHHKLKPWRHHMWLTPKKPRDAEFYTVHAPWGAVLDDRVTLVQVTSPLATLRHYFPEVFYGIINFASRAPKFRKPSLGVTQHTKTLRERKKSWRTLIFE